MHVVDGFPASHFNDCCLLGDAALVESLADEHPFFWQFGCELQLAAKPARAMAKEILVIERQGFWNFINQFAATANIPVTSRAS